MHNTKVVIVGNCGVGKSKMCSNLYRKYTGKESLAHRIVNGDPDYNQGHKCTLGVIVASIELNDGVCIDLWDTAGNPKFSGLKDGYYINADKAVIVSGGLGESVDEYRNELERVCTNLPTMLVNNVDLLDYHKLAKFVGLEN
jgi:GTP-binding nuclear protein Ran